MAIFLAWSETLDYPGLMQQRGVRYALSGDGLIVYPETAARLSRTYRCLDCNEFVYLRKGDVRQPHFAHYVDRPHPCSAETVTHEAAKRKLVERLKQSLLRIMYRLECTGFLDTWGSQQACIDRATREQALDCPAFDDASIEFAFGRYRFDAAATLLGQVVLGFEVYQSHRVDAGKAEALLATGLPWVELYAEEILEQDMPWTVVSSSLGTFQCKGCAKDQAEALADRQLRAAAERARARHEQTALNATLAAAALAARCVPVALKNGNVVFAGPDRVGKSFTCFVCKRRVKGERLADGTFVFLHDPGRSCDARRAWVRAGMWEVYKELQASPGRIWLSQPCSGPGCIVWLRGRLPAFDRLEAEEPSIVLYNGNEPGIQFVFGRKPQLIAAPRVVELRPGKAVHCPTRLVGAKDGSLCSTCEERRVRLETLAKEKCEAKERELKAREEAEADILRRRRERESAYTRSGAFAAYHSELLRRKVTKRVQEPERVQQAVAFAMRYFREQGIALRHAQTHGVVVRRCEHCRAVVALLHISMVEIPEGLEHVLTRNSSQGKVLHNRCGSCRGSLGNAHDQLEPGAVYLLPEHFRAS